MLKIGFYSSQVLLYLAVTELIGLVYQTVEEISVVRYNNQGTIIFQKSLLEDFLALDIV